MSSSTSAFSLSHFSPPPPTEQLCYVHCNFCDTVLAVSVPCSSLFKTVAVRCGHCTNILSVNMKGLLLPATPEQIHLNHGFLPSYNHNILDELPYPPPSCLMDHALLNSTFHHHHHNSDYNNSSMAVAPLKRIQEELPRNLVVSRHVAAEKRQRVPSAYNCFIKDEIQRLKAENPDMTHREAFSAAAKNWAHFPHIHFGLTPDQTLTKSTMHQQDGGEDVLLENGFYAASGAAVAAANMRITPF